MFLFNSTVKLKLVYESLVCLQLLSSWCIYSFISVNSLSFVVFSLMDRRWAFSRQKAWFYSAMTCPDVARVRGTQFLAYQKWFQ